MSEKYERIDAEKANYPIIKMCAWLGVSNSGFHEWRTRAASFTAQRQDMLKKLITEIFNISEQTYGYRRVWAELDDWHIVCCPETVRALMRELGLVACQPKPYRPTTTLAGDTNGIPDLVARDFTADAPGTKLVGDITYIPTRQGWVYLATVIDCYSKAVIGYAIADHMRAELVCAALQMAARNHRLEPDCIFHSDRGVQYTSAAFAETCTRLNVRRSMGRTGVCWDNAMAESFNAALKVERVHRVVYINHQAAYRDIAQYIEIRYNRQRRHSGIGYRIPLQVHYAYPESQASA